jgi:hypothetical protein
MDTFWKIDLNEERAHFIKDLRVNNDYTWRAVAREYSEKYMDEVSSNQLLGIELCMSAMEFLGEKIDSGWN